MDVRTLTDQMLSRLAGQAQRSGDWEGAKVAFGEIVRRRRGFAKAWVCLGESTAKSGFTEEGIAQVRRGVLLQGNVGAYRCVLANLLFLTGRCDESLEEARKVVELERENWAGHILVARNLERIGRVDEGLSYLRKVRTRVCAEGGQVDGGILNAMGQLLFVSKEYEQAKDLFEEVLERGDEPGDVRRSALNGMGQVLDRLGCYGEAFDAFTQCALVTKGSASGKAFGLSRALGRITMNEQVYTAELLDRFKNDEGDRGAEEGGRSPVFLVGFPRSGTTLVEQIFAAHEDVITSGERPILETMGKMWSQHAGVGLSLGELVNSVDDACASRLRKWYFESASRLLGDQYHEEDGVCLVDKQPMNITELGLIQMVFPRAKVIVMLRDARDICLSCYFQDFRLNEATGCFLDLKETARYYHAVMRWYLQLRDRLSLSILEIRYEDMVDDFEKTVRRMTEFAGLPWDEGMLHFQEKTRIQAVTTPSGAAVREPVSRKSVGRWKNYREYVEDMEVARWLEEFVD